MVERRRFAPKRKFTRNGRPFDASVGARILLWCPAIKQSWCDFIYLGRNIGFTVWRTTGREERVWRDDVISSERQSRAMRKMPSFRISHKLFFDTKVGVFRLTWKIALRRVMGTELRRKSRTPCTQEECRLQGIWFLAFHPWCSIILWWSCIMLVVPWCHAALVSLSFSRSHSPSLTGTRSCCKDPSYVIYAW